jgi:hypothetical protein
MTGGWGKLHNEELHNWNSSLNIIKEIIPRRIRWVRHVKSMRYMKKTYAILIRRCE